MIRRDVFPELNLNHNYNEDKTNSINRFEKSFEDNASSTKEENSKSWSKSFKHLNRFNHMPRHAR